MSSLRVSTQAPASRVSIYGSAHKFEIQGSDFVIKYFQTGISPTDPNGKIFIENLRPVREILDSKDIHEMDQIIQRELDDDRIVNSLVPYILNLTKDSNGTLIKDISGISFFPSVLGVLMPKNYLKDSSNVMYPNPNLDDTLPAITNYSGDSEMFYNWSVEHILDDNNLPTVLAKLTMDMSRSDVMIIDGQHRVNAFRAALGEMNKSLNPVVREIYKDVERVESEKLDLSIPLTLLWFETKSKSNEVKPQFISRKLFIDVNNSARSIAKSRKILLDDRGLENIITNIYYSHIANIANFSDERLSLIHLGYDLPFDLREKGVLPFSLITSPERLSVCFSYFLFNKKSALLAYCNKRKNKLSSMYTYTKKDNQFFDNAQIAKKFEKSNDFIIQSSDDILGAQKYMVKKEGLEILRNEFTEKYLHVFSRLIEDFPLFSDFVKTISDFKKDNYGSWSQRKREAWDIIYFGGTSMFYNVQATGVSNSYTIEINELKEHYFAFFGNRFGLSSIEVKKLIDFSRSIAFQTALFNSFYEFCFEFGMKYSDAQFDLTEYEKLLNEFLKRISNISPATWLEIHSLITNVVSSGELSPNVWPFIEKVIIRLVQNDGEFFDKLDSSYFSPEVYVFLKMLTDNCIKKLDNKLGRDTIQAMGIEDAILELNVKEIKVDVCKDCEESFSKIGIIISQSYIDANIVNIDRELVLEVGKALKIKKVKRLNATSSQNSSTSVENDVLEDFGNDEETDEE